LRNMKKKKLQKRIEELEAQVAAITAQVAALQLTKDWQRVSKKNPWDAQYDWLRIIGMSDTYGSKNNPHR